jgi:hypothetical protein
MTGGDTRNIVPFGKHKGRLLDEVILDDPNYLQWLTSQEWFRAKYMTLYQVIINRGAEPEDTPEHNALQVLFLDDAFCLAFLRCLWPKLDEQATRELKQMMPSLKSIEREEALRHADVGEVTFKFDRHFEERGVDVRLSFTAHSTSRGLKTCRVAMAGTTTSRSRSSPQ